MSKTELTPEEFADKEDLTLEGTEMIAGMEIAEYTDEDGETIYTSVYIDDGTVDSEILEEVWEKGGKTFGRTLDGHGRMVIDDDGVYREI